MTLRVPASLAALHRRRDGYALELADGEWVTPKLVIGADGAPNSQVRRKWRGNSCGNMRSRGMLITVRVLKMRERQHLAAVYANGAAPFAAVRRLGVAGVVPSAPARIRQAAEFYAMTLQLQVE